MWNRGNWSLELGKSTAPRPGSTFALALVVLLAATPGSEPKPSWPQSRPGELASGWVAAFDAGEPAMRRFLAENWSASGLTTKSVDERLVTYRSLREQLGSLALARVVEERPDGLDVTLADAKGTEHDFTFEVESADKAEPRKLRSMVAKIHVEHSMFPH